MADADLVREVTLCVNEAIRKNSRTEAILVALLAAISLVGLALLIIGAVSRQWTMALPGSLCELATGVPIRYLVRLRQENIRLMILPQLIRMADSAAEKKLVMKFIEAIIRQIAS